MGLDSALRDRLLADPAAILEDREVMRALIDAREAGLGGNVVDIRGRAMEALEARLDRLEAAHETVISAAYDNQSGTAVIHRAILAMLEPADFAGFIDALEVNVAPILRVETLRLVMESAMPSKEPGMGHALAVVPVGTVARMLADGRRMLASPDVSLRPVSDVTRPLHEDPSAPIRSEALIPLDLGQGSRPAMLLMGSAEAGRFTPAQGTDLLRFFGQVLRLVVMGWMRD
ncbi:DUF484 family protein [Paracoccus jiaweipingae]|uniref:DUF484 family protein n=1 Tax=unclassified Paracoccus (in: a-proteobacteria) TaxID=2688777 RepID=UPI00379E80AC